jgi:hypothetical protein
MSALSIGSHSDMKRNISKWANAGKIVLAGALFGIAVVNTVAMIVGSSPSDSAENIGMASGAAVFAVLLKILHIV